MKNSNFDLSKMHVNELTMNELIEIEGGKFWDTILGKVVMAVLIGFAGAVGANLADELFD